MKCPVCKTQNTKEMKKFIFNSFVTSDCKPIKFNFNLYSCGDCNHTFKQVDRKLKIKIDEIYDNYTPYHSGDGKEQKIVSENGFVKRSEYILNSIKPYVVFEKLTNHLDIGCGVGATLGAMSRLNEDVMLYGMDVSNGLSESIIGLQNFSGFYHSLEMISDEKIFDLITLIHTIEHIKDLDFLLVNIRKLLNQSGKLLIQIPNPSCNPFDYLIIDHIHHFSERSLIKLLIKNGFSGINIIKNLVNKEITIIANISDSYINIKDNNPNFKEFSVEFAIDFLNKYFINLKKIIGKFYIFGTAISATWLYGCFKDKVMGFLDEDEDKQGKNLFELLIKKPQEIQRDDIIVIPLIGPIKSSVLYRINKYTKNIY